MPAGGNSAQAASQIRHTSLRGHVSDFDYEVKAVFRLAEGPPTIDGILSLEPIYRRVRTRFVLCLLPRELHVVAVRAWI